jgi:hypothetical protein
MKEQDRCLFDERNLHSNLFLIISRGKDSTFCQLEPCLPNGQSIDKAKN